MNANEVAILIRAKDEATKTFKEVNDSADGLGKTLGDVGKIAGGFLAANVIGSAVEGFRGFMSGAVTAASDLGESLNAVNVIFGDSADTVLKWGKDNASSFGLSQRAFNQMATPLGAMLKNTGMSMDDVADNTINLTKRAADMASVFNTDVDEALTAIQAALRGESDPIEKYGVSLNAAAVEAKALAMTGKESAKALTDQEKSAARLAIIFDQTAAAAGDFANTSDGLANSQRIQAAQTEELQAKIGQKLIPVMLKINELKFALVQILADKLIPAFEAASRVVGPVLGAAFEFLAEVGGRVVGVIKTFVDYIKFTVSEGDALNDFLSNLPGPLQGIAKFLGDAVLGLKSFIDYMKFAWTEGDALNDFLEGVPAPVRNTALAFGTAAVALKEQLIPNVKDAQHYFSLGFSGGQVGGELGTIQMAAFKVGQTFREDIIPATKEMAAFVVEQITMLVGHLDKHFARFPAYFNEEVKPALENIMNLYITVYSTIIKWLAEHWPEIMAIVQPVIDEFINRIELAATIITGVLDIIIKLLQGDWAGAWNSAKQLFAGIWDSMLETISNAKELISGILNALTQIAAAAFGEMADAATSKMSGMKNGLLNAVADIKYGLIEAFQQTKDWIGRVWDGITDVIKAPINAAIGFINRLIGAWNGISFSFPGVDMPGPIPDLPGVSVGTPDIGYIPYLAKGGIVTRPTLAVIGEAGPEAVVPLSKGGAMGTVNHYHINVQALDGTSAAQIIMRELVKWERRGGIAPGTTRAVA